MDVNRCRIYFMYSFTILVGIALDFLSSILTRFIKKRWIYNIASLVIFVAVGLVLFSDYGVRPAAMNSRVNILQTNGAVYCMYRIKNQSKDNN